MSQTLTKNLYCVQMRSGVEIWLEKERVEQLQDLLSRSSSHKFINIDDCTLNTADIVGVFTANHIADMTRRRNGQWQCKWGTWHEKRTECSCWHDKEPKGLPAVLPEPTEEERQRNITALEGVRSQLSKRFEMPVSV